MPFDQVLRSQPLLNSPNLIEGMIVRNQKSRTYPNASGATAQVQTLTPGVGTAEVTTYRLIERTTGQTVSFTSDASPSAAEVVTGLLPLLRANTILNGLFTFSGTTTIVATSRTAGANAIQLDFADNGSTPTNVFTVANTTASADPSVINAGRGLVVTSTYPNRAGLPAAALSSTNVFVGILGFDPTDSYAYNYPGSPNGLFNYPFASLLVLEEGEIVLKPTTAPTRLSPVYLIYSGSNAGKFAASSVANSVQITNMYWQSSADSNGLAIAAINKVINQAS